MELIFLGTSAGVPTRARNVSAALINLRHPTRPALWLIDCGEGTQQQMQRTAWHPGKLDRIFITHLHGDHIFGLPGLLCSRSMAGNVQPLTIYGPKGLREFIDTALRLIDKRVSDLQVLQHAADQTLPMIRLIQANAIQLIEKFSAVRDITIPMWRNQFAIQLSLADQRNAVELANAIDDASNELMRKNAELVHSTAVGTARANQRSVIDIETLRTVNETLIRTVEEVREIHREGMARRRQLSTELVDMREDLEKRLALPTAGNGTP